MSDNQQELELLAEWPKPDFIKHLLMKFDHTWYSPNVCVSWDGDIIPKGYDHSYKEDKDHLRFVFDGETGKLKSVEVLS